jgi:cold shock CspA family protein
MEQKADERIQRVVKSWNADRSFGFIARNDGGSHLFCHIMRAAAYS